MKEDIINALKKAIGDTMVLLTDSDSLKDIPEFDDGFLCGLKEAIKIVEEME